MIIFELLFDFLLGALVGKSWGCFLTTIGVLIGLIGLAIWFSL